MVLCPPKNMFLCWMVILYTTFKHSNKKTWFSAQRSFSTQRSITQIKNVVLCRRVIFYTTAVVHCVFPRMPESFTTTGVSTSRSWRLMCSWYAYSRMWGMARWLECRTRDRKVPGSSPTGVAGEFSSPGSTFRADSISVSVPPLCYRSST